MPNISAWEDCGGKKHITEYFTWGCSNGGKNEDAKEGRELGLSGLLYAGDLVLCGESEEDLRAMVGSFVGVYKRRSESQCR